MSEGFRALMVSKEPEFRAEMHDMTLNDLPAGDVTIRVHYSSINFKDGLALIPHGKVIFRYPMVPGVDLAGVVRHSSDKRFHEGDQVLVTSYGLGVQHFGGFSEYARVPADWVIPKPPGLSLREAMIIGTAGLTAGISITQLERNGLRPDQGPVLVTGASGGVGSFAVDILARLGYHVVASTGKASAHAYLQRLGADVILSREDVSIASPKALEAERWAGAVDPVGGETLAYVLKTTQYGGSVAVCGLTGGSTLSTTVFPFILRGVNLLGIDSVSYPYLARRHLWERLGSDLKPRHLEDILAEEISLEEIPAVGEKILRGEVLGRVIVRV
ncbi:oxidoreductase [Sulfobacillus sp. hq2]|uniref:oxidoreductase n=1 Tax=Sulfobacillus TaxID=28033 RepID=UPI000CD0B15C|nr:oxidoreductase [Sulfobacillus sp. hq2]POB11288.1 oxidoreductase [Sulfobacillus sp. hq2]